MKTMLQRSAAAGTFLLCVLMSAAAAAKPVVVGSVNPETRQVTMFHDLLVWTFKDGTPIRHIYGVAEISNGFLMVRAGKSSSGICQTDAFRLVRLPGNRLAIAHDNLVGIAWDGSGTIKQLKKCFSGTCQGNCQVLGVTETPLDLNDYQCHCSNATGQCQATLPGGVTRGEILDEETLLGN